MRRPKGQAETYNNTIEMARVRGRKAVQGGSSVHVLLDHRIRGATFRSSIPPAEAELAVITTGVC